MIPKGARHPTLWKRAMEARRNGASYEECLQQLALLNLDCEPPKGGKEVRRMATWIYNNVPPPIEEEY